jgi:hypothetical protein
MNLVKMKDFLEIGKIEELLINKSNIRFFGMYAYSFYYKNNDCLIKVISDIRDSTVYKMIAVDYKKLKGFEWLHPNYEDDYYSLLTSKMVTDEFRLYNITPIRLIDPCDILEKSKKIINNEEYDDLVTIPIDLTDEELIMLTLEAHKLDVTLNEYVMMFLENYVEQNNGKQ